MTTSDAAQTSAAELATLLSQARPVFDQNDDAEAIEALMALFCRDDAETVAAATALLADADPANRCLGAAVLGQMGGAFDEDDEDGEDADEDDEDEDDEDDDEAYAEDDELDTLGPDRITVFALERAEALLSRYAVETDPRVLSEIGGAFGHLGWHAAVPALVAKANHPVATVRYGVVLGLTGQTDAAAVGALVRLSADADDEVRNWATFALGTQLELDTPAVRAALRARLTDAHEEARGEALLGLARRHDADVIPAVISALLADDALCAMGVEAAIELGRPELHGPLVALRALRDTGRTAHFQVQLDEAIARCDPDAEV